MPQVCTAFPRQPAGRSGRDPAFAQEEAAKVGANGVLLTQVGDRSSGALGVGVGGGGISTSRPSAVAGGGSVSGGAPIVQNAAQRIAIYIFDQR